MKEVNLIKKYRKLRNMTQKQVGDSVGISDVAVRQYELFKRKPKDEILRKIAKALNVKFSYLKEAHYPYTSDEIFNILVKYEEKCNIDILETQNNVCIRIADEKIKSKLLEWNKLKNKLYNKEITQEEYEIEKANL